MKCQSNNIKANLLFVDTTFLDVFSFPLLEGDPSKAFANKGDVLISESFARKQFGNTNPIGQQIEMGYDFDTEKPLMATISGIIKDIKNSVIPNRDIIVRIDNIKSFNPTMDSPTFDNARSALIFILAKPNANLQTKTDDMASYFKEIFWIYKNGLSTKVVLTPLRDAYFADPENYQLRQGSLSFVMLLISIGFAILLFAVINYINLTVAQTGFRAKEMAMRRLLGASRKDLVVRLLSESICMSFVSFVLGADLCIRPIIV